VGSDGKLCPGCEDGVGCLFQNPCRPEDRPEPTSFFLYACMFGHVFEVQTKNRKGIVKRVPQCPHCKRARRWSSQDATPSFGELIEDEATHAIYRLGGHEAAARHHFGVEENVEESRNFLLKLITDEQRKKIYGE